MDALDRQRPLYEAVLPVRLTGPGASTGSDRVIEATVRLLTGTRHAGGGQLAKLLYLEVVDDKGISPHALSDRIAPGHIRARSNDDVNRSTFSFVHGEHGRASASGPSDSLLHHSAIVCEADYPALASDQALTVGWTGLPSMVVQLLEAARTGMPTGGDHESGRSLPATPRFDDHGDGMHGGNPGARNGPGSIATSFLGAAPSQPR